jgi:type IV secretion system protein TrbL
MDTRHSIHEALAVNPSSMLMALFLAFGIAEPALAAGALDQIQQQYQTASSSWMNAAIPYANHLFTGLAALEFSWAGIQFLLRKNDLPEFLTSVTLKVLSIGFFFTLLTMAPIWLPLIINSFTQAGSAISGTATLTPSGVFSLGPQIAGQIITVLGSPSMGLQALGSYFFSAITAGLSGLIVVIAYAIAALQLLMTLIESYIVIGGGLLMLGFLGSRWTLPFGEKYFGYAISVGIKLFVLYLIIGMGPSMANAIINDLQTAAAAAGTGSPPPGTFLTAAATSLIFGALAFMVPGLAGSLMNGSPSMSLGNIGTAGAVIAGGVAGVGALGLSASARMANGTIGAAKSMGSIGTLAREQGVGTALKTGAGAMGGMALDAAQGISGQSNQGIAKALGERAIQGWGAGTTGGNLANRIRMGSPIRSPASTPAPPPEPDSGNGGSGIQSTSAPDGFTGGQNPPSPSGGQGVAGGHPTQNSDPNRLTGKLDRLADRHLPRNLPHDGHAGGISIRLNHTE